MPRQTPVDHNYEVSGLSPGAKSLVTKLENAAMEYAFRGAKEPDFHNEIVEGVQIARYNLEIYMLSQQERLKNG